MSLRFQRSTPTGLKAFQIGGAFIKEQIGLDEISREIHLMDGEVCLGSIFFWWAGPCAVVEALAVEKEHRGKGLGKTLLLEAERDMIEAGCKQISLTSLPFQAPFFYEKLGYKQIGTIPNFFEGYDLAVYRKLVPGASRP